MTSIRTLRVYAAGRKRCELWKIILLPKKKLRKLRDFPCNIFFPQIFLPATISAYKVLIPVIINFLTTFTNNKKSFSFMGFFWGAPDIWSILADFDRNPSERYEGHLGVRFDQICLDLGSVGILKHRNSAFE